MPHIDTHTAEQKPQHQAHQFKPSGTSPERAGISAKGTRPEETCKRHGGANRAACCCAFRCLNRPGFTGEFFVQASGDFIKGVHAFMEGVLYFLRRLVAYGSV